MNILRGDPFQKGATPTDLTVFIDVFRGSTTLAYLLHADTEEILLLNDYPEIKKRLAAGYTLVSEVFKDGLDNSPTQLAKVDVKKLKLVHKTGNLTEAIFKRLDFKRAFLAGFVNIDTVADAILRADPGSVEIIPSAYHDNRQKAIEDEACAEMLGRLLRGETVARIPRHAEILDNIEARRQGPHAFPPHYFEDLKLALGRNTLPVVPEIVRTGPNEARCIRAPGAPSGRGDPPPLR